MKKYNELEKERRKGLTGRESLLISTLARLDKKIFGIEDARAVIVKDTGRVMSSLMSKKWVLPLKKGLYAIVPLDVGVKGADSFILHNFVIASHLAESYYIGYWSALNHHGLSEQIPRTTFVATTKAKMPLNILDADYYFVKLEKRKFFGFERTEIEGWKVNISSPEKTLADCLDYPEHSGGIEEVARAIYLNHEEIDMKKVYKFGEKMGNNTILKRLGCILEATGLLDKYGGLFSDFAPSKGYTALDPVSPRRGKHTSRWGLLVNFDLRPERWMY
jgi:predicted transcriptional regulator of viral defense system